MAAPAQPEPTREQDSRSQDLACIYGRTSNTMLPCGTLRVAGMIEETEMEVVYYGPDGNEVARS